MRLNFRNPIQQALFKCELRGQISDGMWENTKPYGHYKVWFEADITCDPNKPVGRNFSAEKSNYNFTSRDLLDVVGERMVWICNLAEKQKFSIEEIYEFYDYQPYTDSADKYWRKKAASCARIFGSYEKLCSLREGSYDMRKLKEELTDMKAIVRSLRSF